MSDIDSYRRNGLNQWLADQHQKSEYAGQHTIFRELGRDVASWDLSTCLAMRTHPIFHLTGFRHRVQKLALDVNRVRDLTRALDLTLDLTRDLIGARARDRARTLTRDLDRARARVRDLARDLDRVCALDLVRTSDLARNLDPVCALLLDLIRVLDLVLDLTTARDRALADAHAYGLSLIYGAPNFFAFGMGLSFARTITVARDRCRELCHALTVASNRALTLDHALDGALDRDGTTKALIDLHNVLSDVTGVDLRCVDLAGIFFEGLRWSACTQWPPRWEAQIRRDSVEVTKGIFQIISSGTTYTLTKV